MSSTKAPYATLHDLPKWEKRPDVATAPWSRDQATVRSSRGHDPLPYVTCNSQTAPFATIHNTPNEVDPKTEQPCPINEIQFSNELKQRAPSDTSDDSDHYPTQASLSKIHEAPWDRNDEHCKVQPKFSHGENAPYFSSSHAPYATDSQRG